MRWRCSRLLLCGSDPRRSLGGRPLGGYRRRVAEQQERTPERPRATASPLAEAVGGPLGVAEATLPFIAFTIAWTAAGRDVAFGAIVAVAISASARRRAARSRASQRSSRSPGWSASRSAPSSPRAPAKPAPSSCPGILINAAWLTAYLVSIAIRRPLLGFFISKLDRRGRRLAHRPQADAGLLASQLDLGRPLRLTPVRSRCRST